MTPQQNDIKTNLVHNTCNSQCLFQVKISKVIVMRSVANFRLGECVISHDKDVK